MRPQSPSTTEVIDSSGWYKIIVITRYCLTEEELSTIVAVVEEDVAFHYKLFDIGIDISVATGFCNVVVSRTKDGFTVTIS